MLQLVVPVAVPVEGVQVEQAQVTLDTSTSSLAVPAMVVSGVTLVVRSGALVGAVMATVGGAEGGMPGQLELAV
jgi:hypothetical protein